MVVNFKEEFLKEDLGINIRAILGVPEEILDNDTIFSPVFSNSASRYINNKIANYDTELLQDKIDFIKIGYMYYVCYLLCVGMYARLPKQMENLSTKTILQNIDWDKKAEDMLSKCNGIMDDIISEIDDSIQYGNTYATLSQASEYPNTNI